MQANLDWFAHYIWGEAIPKDSPLLGASEMEEKAEKSEKAEK
jgi:hypothetical protein